MKKIALYVLLVLGATFTTVSCSNDYLNVDYYSIVNPDGVYEDADNVFMGLVGVYNTLYARSDWYVKPHPALANLPAMDWQADGWDAEMSTHSWGVESKSSFFEYAWKYSYKQVAKANLFLADLERSVTDAVMAPEKKRIYESEVRCIRAYAYYFLTINFSRVPMLMTGETFATNPEKARPESDAEAWGLIKEDFEYAAKYLDWKPADGMKGRVTKAMALAYAAKANMYIGDFKTAKEQLKDVIDHSGKSLNPVHGMIHWRDNPDSQETIWEVSFPEFPDMGAGMSAYRMNYDYHYFSQQFRAHEYQGWGDTPISYEFVRCFEPGDKRLMYNVAVWHGDHGDVNPYTNQQIGLDPSYQSFFMNQYEGMPNNHLTKWWKSSDNNTSQSVQLYRFTEVLLNYAECCFETGDTAEGWKAINEVRNRAWGNLEVGYNPNDYTKSKYTFPIELLNTAKVEVPDAEAYYTKYANKEAGAYLGVSWASKGIPVWKVALTQERRKEFTQEFCFWYDLCRMNLNEAWLDCEYPKNGDARFYNTKTGQYLKSSNPTNFNQPYEDATDADKPYLIPVQARDWDWNPIRKVYPIPTSELTANKLCTQNEGY